MFLKGSPIAQPAGLLKCATAALLSLCSITNPGSVLAEADWSSITVEIDFFVGNDYGYTSGIFYSWYDTADNNKAEIGFLARAMKWSLTNRDPALAEVSIKTIGQSIVTPDDITLEDPPLPPDDLPYGGLLFYTDTWVRAYSDRAELIGATLGIVGEYSFAEELQTSIHEILDGDEPEGWDTQLNDEIVFQLSRAHVWRSWISSNGNSDILLGADAALGTLSSSAGVTAMYRYGRQLERSLATALLIHSRAANPVATRSGWFIYAGMNAHYLANHIFLDGNTFDNDGQESMEYENEAIGVTVGMAYAWQNHSLTFAFSDLNVTEDNCQMEEYSRFGTLTFAWKHK
jgi:lipid A 3-O-deacylase